MKKVILATIIILFLGAIPHVFAATGDFVPLAPITGLTEGIVADPAGLATFFNNLYKYLVGLAATLAVIEIIWGGLEIALNKDDVSKLTDSKGKIYNAILGLILVLSPVLVFSIINPSILNLSLNLPPIKDVSTNAGSKNPSCTLTLTSSGGPNYTLSWTSSNANTLTISGGGLSLSASDTANNSTWSVTPGSGTVYTGTATSGDGSSSTCAAQISGSAGSLACKLTKQLLYSSTYRLNWVTTGATSFQIDNGVGGVMPVDSGSKTVTDNSDTTYTGTVYGSVGKDSCSSTGTLLPTCTISVTHSGSTNIVSWESNHATTFYINKGIGEVGANGAGSQSVDGEASTIYTGTATGESGSTKTCMGQAS